MAAARLAVWFGMIVGVMTLALSSRTSFGQEEKYDRELERQIRAAVKRGVSFLRHQQSEAGGWTHRGDPSATDKNLGATALCALAMLFADVDVDDDAVQTAVSHVRAKAGSCTYTYSLALSLCLLDRINKGADAGLIKQLGQRLLQGQTPAGGWSYASPGGGIPDNSNTQLALMALFMARKHGVEVQAAFKRAEKHFRESQHEDGGWSYQVGGIAHLGRPSAAMTCAGLLALAYGYNSERTAIFEGAGTDVEALDPQKLEVLGRLTDPRNDPQVRKALNYLRENMRAGAGVGGEHFAYFLWTLERTCLVYEWRKIKDLNWYYWGARLLLPLQQESGSWSGDMQSGPLAETAFALLFLCKADLIGPVLDFAVFVPGRLRDIVPKAQVKKPEEKQRAKQPKAEAGRKGQPGEATALQEELRTAVGDRLEEILDLLEKTQGSEYTEALVKALAFVRAEIKPQVRAVLARRFVRLKASSLRGYLQHDKEEYRRAAAVAAGVKKEKELLPELIHLMRDPNPEVAEEGYQALRKTTGRDFGKNVRAWDKWWQEQNK